MWVFVFKWWINLYILILEWVMEVDFIGSNCDNFVFKNGEGGLYEFGY